MTSLGTVLKPFFRVSHEEANVFSQEDTRAIQRLETVIATVTRGCQATLQNSKPEALVACMKALDPELRGFGYEGIGTGLAALDCLMPWKDRTKTFIEGAGSPYIYAVHLGAGMALARLHRKPERFLNRCHPIMGWMILDGYGFHEGFFARKRTVEKQLVPAHLSPYARCVFDHGIGRSIWFLANGDINRVASTIGAFAQERQADLWNGVGLACGYTGGVDRAAIELLQKASGPHQAQLAVGAAIAADARQRAHSPAPYAELAVEVLCGSSIEQTSRLVNEALQDLPGQGTEPAYKIWRQRLAAHFATRATV